MSSKKVSFGYNRDNKSSFLIDAVKEKSFVHWFQKRPIISFNTDDVYLIYDPPEVRRKYIDLFASQTDNDYLNNLLEYKYWLSCRNTLLSTNFNALQCDIYDEKLSETGFYIIQKRAELIEKLQPFLKQFHFELSESKENLEILYESTMNDVISSKNGGKNVFYTRLKESRNKDLFQGYTTVGPHRDNVVFMLNNRDAKRFCSQGQCRSIVLSLRLATSVLLEKYCNEKVIYLIDDTVAELDTYRTDNFFPLIQNRGQIFIAVPYGKSPSIDTVIKFRIGE